MDQFKGQPRLPKFAVPKRYDIRLKPDLNECRFSGSVSVNLNIVTATNFIVLNAAELTVSDDAVSFINRDSSKVLPVFFVTMFLSDLFIIDECFCRFLNLQKLNCLKMMRFWCWSFLRKYLLDWVYWLFSLKEY